MEKAFRLFTGDSLALLKTLPANSVDSCVCDPPYHLTTGKKGGSGAASLNLNSPAGRARISTGGGFMGMKWDGGDTAFRVELWAEVFRVLKPGAHLVAFGGTRTYHRMVCAIEDAGFEIRDQIGWVYGSGFPKSLDVSKAIDKAAGAKRKKVGSIPDDRAQESIAVLGGPATAAAAQWNGWGTALKPAWEPIVLARKPLIGTVAQNVLQFGTGAINVDAGRVPGATTTNPLVRNTTGFCGGLEQGKILNGSVVKTNGRWPANIIHDGSEEVMAEFAKSGEKTSGKLKAGTKRTTGGGYHGGFPEIATHYDTGGDTGTAARFFYCAKASKKDRDEGCEHIEKQKREAKFSSIQDARPHTAEGYEYHREPRRNNHPTVKPTALMRYLCKLITPPGGTVLDCFMGSGSTGKAAKLEGFRFIGMDLSKDYVRIAKARISAAA